MLMHDVVATMLVIAVLVLAQLGRPLYEPAELRVMLPALLCFPLAKLACGLYPGHGLTRAMRLRQALLAVVLGIVTVLSTVASIHIVLLGTGGTVTGSSFWAQFAGAILLIAFIMLVGDPILRRLLLRVGLWCEPVTVFGGGDVGAEVIRQLKLDPHLGYKPVCLIDDNAVYLPDEVQGVPYMRSEELDQHAEEFRMCSTALVVDQLVERSALLRLHLSGRFEHVLLVPSCYDLISLKSAVQNLGGILTLRLVTGRLPPLAALAKRSFDVLASVAGLVVLSPLLAVIALVIRWDSPGPLLFRQPRWGGDDRSFGALKFRTMHLDAERRLQRHFLTNPADQRAYERYHKLDNDPRVTRVGRFLRATSLDELPQLLNVLKGEMSIVGPRPYSMDELQKLGVARIILSQVRPGITGYWQVSGRNQRTFRERIAMDCYYVRNVSISLDLWILYRTVISIVMADGK